MKKVIYILTVLCWTVFNVNAQEARPNIVLIVADDLGFADISLHGSKQINTPNIDQLAFDGVLCTEGYTSAPVCSPSRAGFITGRHQVKFGYDNNLGGNQPGFDPEYLGLPLSEKTIATRLKDLGYKTALIGKWHLGSLPKYHPTKRGFEEFWGYTSGGHDYFIAKENGKGYKAPIECNYKTPQKLSYITDDKGDECVDFIKRHKNEPFFLYASFNAPHTPLQATEADLKLFSHIEDKERRTYLAMVHRLDINIGRITETLKKEGLYDDTIIMFISDNGGPVNHNASVNAPYNGQKGILFEGGIHVPYIVSWPKVLPKGKKYTQTVSALDFAPTMLVAAGGEITEDCQFDGVNLVPYFTGINKKLPHEELMWKFTISAAYRKGKWKLVRLPDRMPALYDLSKDVSEQHNVSLKYQKKTEEMLKELGQWDVTLPHPVFLEGAVWKKRQLDLYDAKYQLEQPKNPKVK
ncbi:sulfatase-like hydrolase/transferase [Flammeovirga aprica]|uniref:Sulfatase-like hydrolase/transferase n=1 Tax=Flammeovirga aprica JL-4 TaxID=694437 RepID=A0A7X9RUW4_9BACT|nr:sulfatase-like hydrolase/transferase [Flammeovirga aprica]NME69150.1 sulfatase-like hydrolase/transferase [Flammeovirga aprica JL-4]